MCGPLVWCRKPLHSSSNRPAITCLPGRSRGEVNRIAGHLFVVPNIIHIQLLVLGSDVTLKVRFDNYRRDEMVENLQRSTESQRLSYQMSNLQLDAAQAQPGGGAYPSGPLHQQYPSSGPPPPPPHYTGAASQQQQQVYPTTTSPPRQSHYAQQQQAPAGSSYQWSPTQEAPQQNYNASSYQTANSSSSASFGNPMHQQQPAPTGHSQNVASYFTDLFK